MAITLVLAFGMVWVSTRSKFVPCVVEVDKVGYAIGAPSALTENTTRISTDQMVRYELAAFIRNARDVITDPAAEHQLIGQVYSRARGPAYKFLENYYHQNDLEHDPFKVAHHQSVSVQIDSILPLSKATWQVRWTEEAFHATAMQSKSITIADLNAAANWTEQRSIFLVLERFV